MPNHLKPLGLAPDGVVVYAAEVAALRKAEEKYRAAAEAFTAAENAVKPLRLELASKVLGVKTSDEFKTLSPEQVESIASERRGKGLWGTVRGCSKFRFVKVSGARYPAWRQEFIALRGEVEAEKIMAATSPTYSYRVEVGGQ